MLLQSTQQIVKAIKSKPILNAMPVKLVAIDGHGGAGKTTLSKKLAKELQAEVLHTDDFASWENPMNWWPQMLKNVLDPIKNGANTISYERSDWEHNNPKPVNNQRVTPIMFLEGVSSVRQEFRPYLSFAVWVETPRELCLERGVARDGEGKRSQWIEWLQNEDEWIHRDKPLEYVDVVVRGDK